ncbi:MAG TPA: SMP-30/gluconolactonase/LRE family protein [Candidatus Angelobacter sp.]|nr:SMP-30/gluconolactonase/LRE family protein [Candidatus Angelobacter sp.]
MTAVRPKVPLHRFRTFAEGLDHPEGLAFDADGILWAGGELGQIYKIGRDGKVKEAAHLGGFCLGITLSREQELFVCNMKHGALIHLNRKGRILRSIERVGARRLKTPNFSVFDSQGNLYFTDSGDWGSANGYIHRIDARGRAGMFAGPFAFPNGMALSADETKLYVVQSLKDNVLEVPLLPDGRAGKPRVYATGLARVPDGAAIDIHGNLYVTCYATDIIYKIGADRKVSLFAFDPQGTMIARPTNLAFGGPDFKDVYVANLGRWHICKAATGVRGQPLANQR